MAFLAAAAPYIAAASTAVGVYSAIQEGNAKQQQAQAQAVALRNQANADQAAAERNAIQSRKQASYLVSRGLALAAASGAGATDPTVVSVLGQITGEGEYHALTSVYEGRQSGQNLNAQSTSASNAGKAYQRAGYVKGITTVLSGGYNIGAKGGFGGSGSYDVGSGMDTPTTLATKYG